MRHPAQIKIAAALAVAEEVFGELLRADPKIFEDLEEIVEEALFSATQKITDDIYAFYCANSFLAQKEE